MRISKEQIKLMDSCKNQSLTTSSLNEEELSIVEYLVSRKFMKGSDEISTMNLNNESYCLTEEGKAYLSEYKHTHMQWYFTTAVAFLALVVSFVALLV